MNQRSQTDDYKIKRFQNDAKKVQELLKQKGKDQHYENQLSPLVQEIFKEELNQILYVDFKGQAQYESFAFIFSLDCSQFPSKAPVIRFHRELEHHSIFQGSGVFCIIPFSDEQWKNQELCEVINTVIEHFHIKAEDADYPVNFSQMVKKGKNQKEELQYQKKLLDIYKKQKEDISKTQK